MVYISDMDKLTPEQRSRNMSQIKGKDTKPEKLVRSLLHGMGYRFRLHNKELPGKPDITLPKYKAVIFVHGCFWHGHDCREGARVPKSNTGYWISKIAKNKIRDEYNIELLNKAGWRVLVLWECTLNDRDKLARVITDFLPKNTK